MRYTVLIAGLLAPIVGTAAPVEERSTMKPGDSCPGSRNASLVQPPPCKPNSSITTEETALRAYKFYRAFVVDADTATTFSYIDDVYKQHSPGYADGPNTVWPLLCGITTKRTEASTGWCFNPTTNMSWAQYSTVDRWKWVDGCVHEHWDNKETFPPKSDCYQLKTGTT